AKPATRHTDRLRVKVEPFGAGGKDLAKIGRAVLRHDAVRKLVGQGKHRLLAIEAVEPVTEGKGAKPREPDRFRAMVHDYTAARTLLVDGRFHAPSKLAITESALQPPVTSEEFAEAVQVLAAHSEFAEHLKAGQLVPYRPMPPLIDAQEHDGR